MESFSQTQEGCNSSESGWTMYIGSPLLVDDGDGGSSSDHQSGDGNKSGPVGEDKDEDGGKENNTKGEASDDSMASDASSGPSCYRESNMLMGRLERSCRRNEKVQNKKEAAPKRRGRERRRPAKEEADRDEGSGKVRKNFRFQMGKDK